MLSASLTGSAGLTTDQRGVIIAANADGVLLCRFPELIWEMSVYIKYVAPGVCSCFES